MASSTSALSNAAVSASGRVERSDAFTSGLALSVMRTKEEHRVNGGVQWAEERANFTAAAIDRGWPHQVAVPATECRGSLGRFMDAFCLDLSVCERASRTAARREISLPWTLRYSNPKLHLFNRDI
jgi:hypothetical protein